MKVPPSCDLPIISEINGDFNGYFRSFVRRLQRILEEMVQAINANDTRATTASGSGTGSVKMGNANTADNTGWIEIEENKWIPYWTTPNP